MRTVAHQVIVESAAVLYWRNCFYLWAGYSPVVPNLFISILYGNKPDHLRDHVETESIHAAKISPAVDRRIGSIVARGGKRGAAGGTIYEPCSNHRSIRASTDQC